MIHKTKVKCDIGLGLGGESQGGLYMTLFYKQLLWSPRFSSVGLLLSESLGLCQAGVLCVCGHRGTVGGGLCYAWLYHCTVLPLVILPILWRGGCKRTAGLSVTFMFIPGVGWNNCELYFPLCGTEERLVLLIIEIIQRLSTTFLF